MKTSHKPSMGKQRVSNSPSKEGLKAEKALKMAVAGVIAEHRRLGLPIAVMRNGKAVFVSVDKKVSAARERKASYRTKRKLKAHHPNYQKSFMNPNYQKWKSLQSHWDDDDFLRSLTPLMKLRYRRLSEKVTAIFEENFAQVPGTPLLIDAGAGRGEFALFLKKSWGNSEPWKYLGLEPSPEQLKQRDIPTLGLGFVHATAEAMPLQDMSAQGVLMKEALDHCYDPAKVFSEAKRLLKPGGVLVVTITNDKSYFKRLLPGINKARKATQTDHLFFFGPDDLKKLAREAWFDRVSVETYNYLKFPRFLEIALGWLGEPLNRCLLSLTDAIGKVLLPGMGGGIILKAYNKE